jgi:uncharacterized membrane protein (UPF0127 family)
MFNQLFWIKILKVTFVAAVIAGIIIAVWSWNSYQPEMQQNGISEQAALQVRTVSFDKIELADDNNSRSMGLMNRTELCQKCAMLFVFDQEDGELSFWMKNTNISLDIIFMDQEGTIVTVHSNTTPQTTNNYTTTKPAKYVLEVNAGFAKQYQLEEGVRMSIQSLIDQGVEFAGV